MIVSVNPHPDRNEFELLLGSTINQLNAHAKKTSKKVGNLRGSNLEPYVRDIMQELAIGTPFENSIELISGQKFPDIVAKQFYGIEVKTTTKNHWKTTGNSILESTRVDGVERIFMLFAKLASPIEFRWRPYEEVLSEVVVTHSPRYLIDMDLRPGNTIFDKIGIQYDSLRKNKSPIKPIIEYYRSKLKPGEDLWWIDSDSSDKASNIVIRIWKNLNLHERRELTNRAMVYFPEIFGNSNDKFGRVAIWFTTRKAVVCPNVRDPFTAGGRSCCTIGEETYQNVPRVLINLFNNLPDIINLLMQTPSSQLSEYWKKKTTDETKLSDWIDLITTYTNTTPSVKNINIKEKLTKLTLLNN